MTEEKTSIRYKFPEVYIQLAERTVLYSEEPVNTPRKASEMMAGMLSTMDREYLCVVNLNARLQPINFNIVSIGSLDSAPAPVSNIFKSAILSNASGIILLHNHPSGDPKPSKEDIWITRKVEEASKIMDVRLLDHVIIGGRSGAMYSFQENGLILENMQTAEKLGEKMEQYQSDSKKRMQEITEKLENGIRELQSSEAYRHYLDVMGRFHHYSASNCLLIAMQRPDATRVAGYSAWDKQFQRHVKRGEKGIKIIAPAPYTVLKQRVKYDSETGKPVLDQNGKPETEIVNVMVENYKITTVFDVSQTEGKELPEVVHELKADVENYKKFLSAIEKISPVPIEFSEISGSSAKGYYDQIEKKIVIRSGMGEAQSLKTAVHELSHAILHDRDTGDRKNQLVDRATKEVEAESVAYIICQHFGIDTSDYSFGYVAGWSRDSELSDFKASLNLIQKTAGGLIDEIQKKLREREPLEDLVQRTAEKLSAETCFSKAQENVHRRCR